MGPEERPKPMNSGRNIATIMLTVKLLLKEFGSNRASFRFNTTAKRKFL